MKYDSKTWKAGHSGFLLASICFIFYSNKNIIDSDGTSFIKFLYNSHKLKARKKKLNDIKYAEYYNICNNVRYNVKSIYF